MTLTKIGDGISGLVGAGIIFIGARFLLAPRAAAAGYGISTEQDGEPTDPYFAAKGVRDIASWIACSSCCSLGMPRILGGYMAAASIIPIGDGINVLRNNGPKAAAYWRARRDGRSHAGDRRDPLHQAGPIWAPGLTGGAAQNLPR